MTNGSKWSRTIRVEKLDRTKKKYISLQRQNTETTTVIDTTNSW